MRTQQVCLFDSFEYYVCEVDVTCDKDKLLTDSSVSQSQLKLHCRSNLFQSPISYSHRIPVVEMSINPESVSSDMTPIATSATDSPTKQRRKQRRTVAKTHIFKRKIYGFVLFKEDLDAWGRQQFGDTDDEKVLKGYISKTISLLFNGSYRLWRRTSMHMVSCNTGPRRHESDFCLTLVDNLSSDTASLPSREIIEKMKENLRIEKDPQWYRFDGD